MLRMKQNILATLFFSFLLGMLACCGEDGFSDDLFYNSNHDTDLSLQSSSQIIGLSSSVKSSSSSVYMSSSLNTYSSLQTSSNSQGGASSSFLRLSSSSQTQTSKIDCGFVEGVMTDSRDGQTYKTIQIGEKVWMAQNLNYSDSVMTPSLIGKSWCYEDSLINCSKYGRLYTWSAAIDWVKLEDDDNPQYCDGDLNPSWDFDKECVLPERVQGICPNGWHLPSESEINELITSAGNYKCKGIQAFSFSVPASGISLYGESAPVDFRQMGFEADFWGSAYIIGAHYIDGATLYCVCLDDLCDCGTSKECEFFPMAYGQNVRCIKD